MKKQVEPTASNPSEIFHFNSSHERVSAGALLTPYPLEILPISNPAEAGLVR